MKYPCTEDLTRIRIKAEHKENHHNQKADTMGTEATTTTRATDLKDGDIISEVHPAGKQYGTLTYRVTHTTRMGYGPRQTVLAYTEPGHYTGGILLGKNFHLGLEDTVEVLTYPGIWKVLV